jgi:hypothetical protein
MTRVLSELLGTTGPMFQLSLRQLEGSSGGPNNDIRLSSEILQGVRFKIHELGLEMRNDLQPRLSQKLLNQRI